MEQEVSYENLKYFIESYFNWSMDFADLESLMEEFKSRELPAYVEGLTQEIEEINELKNWDSVQKFVYIYGQRNLNIKKIERMIELLLTKLHEDK
ncbi:contact-dependent growth inhibition system immunity protein [Paenibacillus sp. CMAA1739]|uniref:contact-dependent growth inhibition system immunity protein n=1 Tax=Paenibacillus ottowii TaxID=2315729 RepID=UPI0027301C7A|nr:MULTISPECIES: contact-dependent growth inhibition system immunity protein [Paenibacillus]MDP1508790.1 contact-dependent growth inhibition system immunity protein [Paenibacillus ottowii]MEC4565086.1 contact-dependent growth inhibition system immunity protein [Paenibacillus sp. CMAA1739]